MPYEWLTNPDTAEGRAPLARLHLWPFRSLPKRGFVWFIGGTAALIALPLLMHLGTPILWGLLPFALLTLWGLWAAISRSYRDGELIEELAIWPDLVTLQRREPRGQTQDWQANPHWVQVTLYPESGPVPQYLTLRGAGREVEIGAFLSPEERVALALQLRAALARAGQNGS